MKWAYYTEYYPADISKNPDLKGAEDFNKKLDKLGKAGGELVHLHPMIVNEDGTFSLGGTGTRIVYFIVVKFPRPEEWDKK